MGTSSVRAGRPTWETGRRGAAKGPESGSPCPPLTEYASKEYGQGIRCLLHLPSGDPWRGGERGEECLGVVVCREVKRPARKAGGEPARPDQIPLQPRLRTTPQAEGFTERRSPQFRARTSIGLIGIFPQGNTPFRFRGNSAKTMLYSAGHHHLHPALSKKEHYGPGWAPVPACSV